MGEELELQLFHRGAEANLFLSRLEAWEVVIKQRVRKQYRNPQLDNWIRRERTAKEAAALREARKAGTHTPTVLSVDPSEHSIVMTRLDGVSARDGLDSLQPNTIRTTFRNIGMEVGVLHQGGIVHGDLTTSNVIVTYGNTPFILDFGMSSYTSESEDRGVDLHLLRRSVATSHGLDVESCSRAAFRGYSEVMGKREALSTLKKAAEIARRGRYFALR